MRLTITKSKNSESFFVIKSVTINGKRTSKVIEKLGNLEEVTLKAQGQNPYVWAKQYVELLNKEEKENSSDIILKLSQSKKLKDNEQYTKLGLNKICDEITDKYQFKYDLNSILSRLIYGRIIYPSSKLKTLELSKNFLEQPNFELHDIYRALEVIANESDFIQSELYKNSLNFMKRNDRVLYYDCTNFFFEIEEESGLRQYGKSKENRPTPITKMGLFLDGDGIPMSLGIFAGNTNEQITMKPLEEKIIKDFHSSKFVVCTDAGLASNTNRKFNNISGRSFITTQSIKKLKSHLKQWALDLTSGWKLYGSDKTYNISKLRENEELMEQYHDKTFYKEKWIKENGIEQRLIVTYSVKYQEYQKNIRENQIQRAQKLIDKNSKKIGKPKQNDPKRFISTISITPNGEVAEENHYELNYDVINEEAKYDGLYAVCTNLEDNVQDIIKINHRRWEIEESFRLMKSEFKSRPVYLSRDDRIKAHFTTCFLALTIFRYLEKILDEKFTAEKIIDTLRNYNFRNFPGFGYVPLYTSSNLIHTLHEKTSINTNYEILNYKKFKIIFKETKL
ncbi:transposase IS4 family protein [Firmicutes bacterium CAG:822]|nr:transposase IS4 family protein [Firmicutes bacterium CAG:822]